MGIDIFAHWQGQSEHDKELQVTGFSVFSGHVGYLREAYHGEPYATVFLCAEAFGSQDGNATIPAQLLRQRLARTLELAADRERKLYNGSDEDVKAIQKSFNDFVMLCEQKEAETGEPVVIHASY